MEVVEFFRSNKNMGLFSTGASKFTMSEDVYNVSGSTPDPPIGDRGWKQLLIDRGINDNCYVTNEKPPAGSSHPKFSVGGHMTTNATGIVKPGGDSYLMPLCHWHNNPARNGKAFQHTKTEMLKLSGFMQGDTSTTFKARLGDGADAPSRIIFETDAGWDFRKLNQEERFLVEENKAFPLLDEKKSLRFVVIKRNDEDGKFYLDFASNEFSNLL